MHHSFILLARSFGSGALAHAEAQFLVSQPPSFLSHGYHLSFLAFLIQLIHMALFCWFVDVQRYILCAHSISILYPIVAAETEGGRAILNDSGLLSESHIVTTTVEQLTLTAHAQLRKFSGCVC